MLANEREALGVVHQPGEVDQVRCGHDGEVSSREAGRRALIIRSGIRPPRHPGPKATTPEPDKSHRQYISTGNLAENPKAFLFLMDYAQRRRVKIWGRARALEGDAALDAQLMPDGYRARAEAAILFEITAWDLNCPQHIPQKFDAADVAQALAMRDVRIAELESEVAALTNRLRISP